MIAHGFPPPSSPDDLLFFDDMKHVLAGEISHYVQVPPYVNHTSVHTLIEVLGFLEGIVGSEEWRQICDSALAAQESDMKRHDNIYVISPQTREERTADASVFLTAIDRFLTRRGGGASRRYSRRRRTTRKKRALK